MIRRDMPEIIGIEQASFDYCWSEEDFSKHLSRRNCVAYVAECREKIVGYLVYELNKNNLTILNLAVHLDWRWKSVGTQMINKLIVKLDGKRRRVIKINVRETNLSAQLFLRQKCFLAQSIKRGFYSDSGEDAYVMEYRLIDDQDW